MYRSDLVVNYAKIEKTIELINTYVKDNDYQFKDNLKFISEASFNEAFNNASKKQRKKLAAFIWGVHNRTTLANINKFFHFLMKVIMKSDKRVRVIKSDREIEIQEKRKIYKEALAKVQAAYADYKQTKGDFYKLKIAKGQVV